MKVVIYTRVSSDRQDTDLSISAQLKELRKYAARNGYTVVREFVDEVESGRTDDRPAFREMVSLAKMKQAPFEAILVWKLNRFARNREDSIIYKSLLRKKGVRVISINEPIEDTPSGRLLEGVIEVIDEFYSANLAEDVKRGMRENASRGYFSGGTPPYGYDCVKVNDGDKLRTRLQLNKIKAPIVKRIFDEYVSGKGLKEIAKGLNQDSLYTRSGKKWASTSIHKIVTNEAYKGTLVWGKQGKNEPVRAENAWAAIVDTETFEKVQAMLKERSPKKTQPRRVSSEYLLSGLLKCSACGKALSGHSAKSGKFFYYRCTNGIKIGPSECSGHWIPKAKLESFVVNKIQHHVLCQENLIELVRMTREQVESDHEAERERLKLIESQLQDVDSRLERLYDSLETGVFASDELAPRIRILEAKKLELTSVKNELVHKQQVKMAEIPTEEDIKGYVDDLMTLILSSPVFERRAFLKSFIKEISIGADDVTIHYTLPMPPDTVAMGEVGVLPFINNGEPPGYRTRDTLIKSNPDFPA